MGSARPITRRLSIGLLLVACSLGAPVLAQGFEFGAYVGYYYPEPAGIDNDVTFGPRIIRTFKDRQFTAQVSFANFRPRGQDYEITLVDITGSLQFRANTSLVPYLFAGPGWADVSAGLFEQAPLAQSGVADSSFTLNFGVGLKAYFDQRRDWYIEMRTTGRWYEARAASTVDREFSIGLGLVYGPGTGAATGH